MMTLPDKTNMLLEAMERYLDRVSKNLEETIARDDDDILFVGFASQAYRRGFYKGEAEAVAYTRHIISGVRNNADSSKPTWLWIDHRVIGVDGHLMLCNFVFTKLATRMTEPCFKPENLVGPRSPGGTPDEPFKVGVKAGIAEIMWGLSEQMGAPIAGSWGPRDPRPVEEIAAEFRRSLAILLEDSRIDL